MNEQIISLVDEQIIGKKRKFAQIEQLVNNNMIDLNFNNNNISNGLFDMSVEYLYEKGLNYKNVGNYFMMIQYLSVASKLNHIESMYILGIHYKNKGNYSLMLKYLKSADLLGHIESTFVLGNYYQYIKSYINMVFYFRRASNKLHIESIKKLYCYYLSQQNIPLFTEYILMGIKLGDDETIFKYAIYNQKTKNYELMKKYYNMLINNLFVKKITTSHLSNSSILSRISKPFNQPNKYQIVALCNLGLYYYEKENNSELMIKYCSLSAEYKNVKSMYALGKYYFLKNNNNNNSNDKSNMEKYFDMVLKSPDPKANFYKGSIYNAFGNYYSRIKYNKELSFAYYTKAHNIGFIPSSYNLAFIYFKDGDYDKMINLFKIVVKSNDSQFNDIIISSMFILSLYYKNYEMNYDLTCYYYNLAVLRGGIENPSYISFINNIFNT